MNDAGSKVVGFLACMPGGSVFAYNDARLIAGSEQALRFYLEKTGAPKAPIITIKKARFEEVLKYLQMGIAHSFDEDAYRRFYPLAREAGLAVKVPDQTPKTPSSTMFVTVSMT